MDERRGRTDGQGAAIGLALHAPVIEQNIAMRRSKSSNNGETGIITLGAQFMRVVLEWDGHWLPSANFKVQHKRRDGQWGRCLPRRYLTAAMGIGIGIQ